LPSDAVIDVPAEQLAAMRAGHHKDYDLDPKKMNQEGKCG